MKNLGLTLLGALVGSLITLGAYTIFFQPEQKVVVQEAPNYTKMTRFDNVNNSSEVTIDFRATAKAVTPAVVHIKSTVAASSQEPNANIPPLFREFFDRDQGYGQRQPRMGSGSGVIISEDGYILTNNHVVDDASELEIVLYDKRTFKGTVVGTDPSTDLALVKINEQNLPTIPFGNSDDLSVGEWVLAVGNPFNLSSTVTAGIVSAKGRSINILGGGRSIESFIQTDAAVNPGNSGGALVNSRGELVGINTAIASPTGAYSGYSFAVPVSIAKKVFKDLVEYGTVQRAFLGISIQNVDGNLAKERDLSVTEGVYIVNVAEGGSADDAGIEAGDVILSVDDRKIKSVPQLQETIGSKRPGDKVRVELLRDNKRKAMEITLKSMEGSMQLAARPASGMLRELGVELTAIDEQLKQELNLASGVQISKLYPGKLRSQTNIREGFVITRIDRQEVKTPEEVEKIIRNADGGVLIEGIYPDTKQKFYYGFGMEG